MTFSLPDVRAVPRDGECKPFVLALDREWLTDKAEVGLFGINLT
jgi:hypothetical protein